MFLRVTLKEDNVLCGETDAGISDVLHAIS